MTHILQQMLDRLREEAHEVVAAARRPKHPGGWKESLVILPVRTTDGKLRFFTSLLCRKVFGKWEYKDPPDISVDQATDRVW